MALLVAVLAAPLLLVLVALPAHPPERDRLVGSAPEVTVIATAAPFTPSLPVTVVVAAAPADVAAAAPPWTGTVTRVLVGPGAAVATGTPLVEVDGVARPYVAAERPFWRPLALRDEVGPDGSVRRFPGPSGPDVDQLHRFLADVGAYDGPLDAGTPFGSASAAAVRELARRMGDPSNPGTFSPGMVVWGERASFEVGRVQAQVGQPAPAPGAPLVSAAGDHHAVAVTDEAGRQVPPDGHEGWRFVPGDGTGDPDGADGAGTPVPLDDLLAGRLPPELVPDGADVQVRGRLQGPPVARAFRLPPAALVLDGGRTCVVPAGGRAPDEVVVVGASSGQVVVTGLDDGVELVAAPASSRGTVRC